MRHHSFVKECMILSKMEHRIPSYTYTVVHKHSRKVPVEPDQSNEHQAFDEMPTSSEADSTQHYTMIYKHTN